MALVNVKVLTAPPSDFSVIDIKVGVEVFKVQPLGKLLSFSPFLVIVISTF
jgi:hypothetical protein